MIPKSIEQRMRILDEKGGSYSTSLGAVRCLSSPNSALDHTPLLPARETCDRDTLHT